MTNPITLRTELEGLVQKWLDTALHFSADGSYLAASAMRACADELSAILSRATPSAAVDGHDAFQSMRYFVAHGLTANPANIEGWLNDLSTTPIAAGVVNELGGSDK